MERRSNVGRMLRAHVDRADDMVARVVEAQHVGMLSKEQLSKLLQSKL